MSPIVTQLLQLKTLFRKSAASFRSLSRASALLPAVLWTLLASESFATSERTEPVVGEISMLLGQAYIVHANGESVPATLGATISVKDTIETGNGGFVHIRFVDDALVTVRPYSLLAVERYDYSELTPENSVVKLRHEEGVARFISEFSPKYTGRRDWGERH
jgi:hypothetical protein